MQGTSYLWVYELLSVFLFGFTAYAQWLFSLRLDYFFVRRGDYLFGFILDNIWRIIWKISKWFCYMIIKSLIRPLMCHSLHFSSRWRSWNSQVILPQFTCFDNLLSKESQVTEYHTYSHLHTWPIKFLWYQKLI